MAARLQNRVLLGLASAATACLGSRALAGASDLERQNFRGRTVSLRGGVGAGLGALAAAALSAVPRRPDGAAQASAATVAVLCATGAGLVDDLDAGKHDGDAPAKGLRGHLGALAHGHVTTGVLKIAVIGGGAAAAGLLLAQDSARLAPRHPGRVQLLTDAAVRAVIVAGWANLANLLDLRPGRALKACALAAAPLALSPDGLSATGTGLLACGVVGVATASAPSDLAENSMLGDTGANALGALLGSSLATHPCPALRATAGAIAVGLVLASEKVSFSWVIDQTPWLAAIDGLGRRRS
ncbi:hypothetical protein [Actinomyces trachealis]|uniref:hypothetical protein n=1 Tax=Actinomyces trachealis TaxID=2763540 RepID=UPI001892CC30|nr:hypothetical protein [Actinomyces trachealis]